MINKITTCAILALTLSCGCATTRKTDSFVSKLLLPVNIGAAYFSSVALHELGHAGPAWAFGASDVDVEVWPVKRDGKWHLGYTTANIELDGSKEAVFYAMGPTAQYLGHLTCRGLLETNKVPRLVQPFLGWLDIFNMIGYYSHVIHGIIRVDEQSDMAKLEPWISWTMLGGAITIDLLDVLFVDSNFARRFAVLFGEDFYEDKKDRHLSLITTPGFIGIKLEW